MASEMNSNNFVDFSRNSQFIIKDNAIGPKSKFKVINSGKIRQSDWST